MVLLLSFVGPDDTVVLCADSKCVCHLLSTQRVCDLCLDLIHELVRTIERSVVS